MSRRRTAERNRTLVLLALGLGLLVLLEGRLGLVVAAALLLLAVVIDERLGAWTPASRGRAAWAARAGRALRTAVGRLSRRGAPPTAGFPSYRQLLATLGWSEVSGRHYDSGVRPVLQEVAAARLALTRGIDLEREPAAARAALGEELWDLVDPGRPARTDAIGAGVPLATVERLVARLEAL